MIAIIVVLYNLKFSQSLTIQRLKAIMQSDLANRFQVTIYDNSPTPCVEELPFEALYVSDTSNAGLSVAYNYQISKAIDNNIKWVLLLDHDTDYTIDCLTRQLNIIDKDINNLVAIVPIMVGQNNHVISPMKINNRLKQCGAPFNEGIYYDLTAINSCAMINVDFFHSIGGLSNDYSLDMLDHWMFARIRLAKKSVYVVDCRISHDLSVLDYNRGMNIGRYINILNSEYRYYQEFGNSSILKSYRRHLLLRAVKHLVKTNDKNYYKITMQMYKRTKRS